ncbi:MAG TPA: ATP-binding protein [Pseudonocardiaceae bacterium]
MISGLCTHDDPRLREAARAVAAVLTGSAPETLESETLDFKEDPTRRDAAGGHRIGARESDAAARLLAEAAACLANHEGGVLVVGVDERRSGEDALIGTDLDAGELRRRIAEITAPPLVVSCREVTEAGRRLLLLLVPRNCSAEPHSATVSRNGGRRTPRRLGSACVDMATVAQLVDWSRERVSHDWSAVPAGRPVSDARSAAVEVLRDLLSESQEPDRLAITGLPDADLLARLQLTRPDGSLNRAGELLLCPSDTGRILYLRRPAPGAPSTARVTTVGRGLIEEVVQTLRAIEFNNPVLGHTETPSGVRVPLPALPPGAIREALVNAVMHRDWDIPEHIVLDHAGDELTVFSPGGFFGGITERTVLTAPSRTRNRALGDVLRSLRLAEREGTGVDRMFIDLIRLGHPRPEFTQRDGGVRVVLCGGRPVPEVDRLIRLLPPDLLAMARTFVAVDLLRRRSSVTAAELAEAAQEGEPELKGFIDRATRAGLLVRTANPRSDGRWAWRLTDAAREVLAPILPYHSRPKQESIRLIAEIAGRNGSVRNADVQDLLGVESVRASELLRAAVDSGVLTLAPGVKARGRSTAYVRTAATTPQES